MKKFLLLILSIFCLSFTNVAQAVVTSDIDAQIKMNKVLELSNYDIVSFVTPGELIGNGKNNFARTTEQYKNTLIVSAGQIRGFVAEINIIKNSPDYSESDKQARIQKIYSDIDAALYTINNNTLNYLTSTGYIMPNLTYKKFIKKFQDYYNSLRLTDSEINITVK